MNDFKFAFALIVFGASQGCMPAHHAGHDDVEAGGTTHRASTAETIDGHHGGNAVHEKKRAATLDPQIVAAARNVKVLPQQLNCASEVLGIVDVHERVASVEDGLDALRVEAAVLGAEAVTGVEFEHGDGKEVTHLSGLAVRCRDLVKGRSYEVIAEIDIPGSMGSEEQAFRALKAKGQALRADLLIGVTFEHGEAGRGGPTRIRATAVRFKTAQP